MPTRRSACRVASTGPRPMISGDSALTPVATIRASGVIPSSRALRSLITTTAAAPSLSGQQLPAVTVPSGRNTGLSAPTASSVTPGRGPSSRSTVVPSGSVDRRDLAREEAVLDRLLGEVLRADRELVLLGSADARRSTPRSPRSAPWRCRRRAAGRRPAGRASPRRRPRPRLGACAARGVVEQRVHGVGQRVAAALDVPADRLHAGGDEHLALAGLDRVHGHPRGLQGRRAVPGERGAGKVVVTEQHRDHPGHVEPGLATGQAAAQHQVVHVRRVQLRHLVQRRAHDGGGQVVRPQVLQRPLECAADR